MLFNSYVFILFFLPITLWIFFRIGALGHHRLAIAWLVGASLFFYGWWNPVYLGLIFASILFNYGMGVLLSNLFQEGKAQTKRARGMLAFGIAANLGVLGYFKYANFFIHNINALTGREFIPVHVLLPLGISFFTFQKIAYLADAHRGEARGYNFLHFCLFVLFFPQLIAGPIVHHKEVIPQFVREKTYGFNAENFAVGLSIFFIGLFKKVILADRFAMAYSKPVFDAAATGITPNFFEAWGGVLGYTLQLYFDFSGYSDMAIGMARMFGIGLPLNFNSPYQAVNIIDFWRRWNMTLSRFLRDYLYIPLGGNRRGPARRHLNLMITMLLGGLWHGAGWTFVFWGALHGIYLMINHGWHALRRALGQDLQQSSFWGRGLSRFLTLMAVMFAWVFFRAANWENALVMIKSMAGINGLVLDPSWGKRLGPFQGFLVRHGWQFADAHLFRGLKSATLLPLLLLALFAPNTQQIMARFQPALNFDPAKQPRAAWFQWRPSLYWAAFAALLTIFGILSLSHVSEFLYFQF